MLEKLKRITKATIPKVVHAAEAVGKSLAKSAKTAEKKIQSSMAGKLIGKAVAAVPTKVSKVGSIALKTAAAVPKSVQTHVKKVNIIREVGANITQTTNSVNKNGTEIKKVETLQKSQRIFEKIQEANKVFFTDFVKGTTGKGALLFWPNVVLQNELPGVYNPRIEAMSYLVKIRKAVVEEYPIINWKVDLYKNLKQKLNSSMEISGNQIYNKNIPFLSDNFGALTNCSDYQKNGNRTPLDKPLYRTINAALIILTPGLDCGVMSDTSIGMAKRLIDNTNIASSKGAYDRGFLIEGAGGMIDGLVSLAINPFDMAEGIVNIYKEPEKYIPVICNEIIDYVNDKIIHGSPEDRAKFKGRLNFEIITFIALSGLGEGAEAPKVLQKSTEAEKGVAEGGKIVEEFNETVKATEGLTTIGKLENAGKSFEKLIDKMRKFIRGEIGSEELLTEELGQAAKSKTGVSINKTEVISKEAGNVGKAEAFEGAGKITSNISPEMEAKILEGQRIGTGNKVIGGHSPNAVNNNSPIFAVEEVKINADGTKVVKYYKQFADGNVSRLKTSTIFPDNWSDDAIIGAIQDVADSTPIGIRPLDGQTLHRGIVNGVEIDVIKQGEQVLSGYPVGGKPTPGFEPINP